MSVQAFSKLPDTLDELDALLNEERSRAEGFTGIRENVRTNHLHTVLVLQQMLIWSIATKTEFRYEDVRKWVLLWHLPQRCLTGKLQTLGIEPG